LFRGKPCFRCFVGDAFDSDECDNCSELGVLGALTLTIGGFGALLAIRAIAGMGDDAGKLNLLDADRLAWRAIPLPADPGCRTCGDARQSG
jgi:adenylyltransferase/sulfurtransferase